METKRNHGTIKRKMQYTGLSIEETIRRAIATNQPLEGNAPPIWTEAAKGVLPELDVRTDRQELALEAMNKYQGTDIMKNYIGQIEYDENGDDGKGNKRPIEQPKEETKTE